MRNVEKKGCIIMTSLINLNEVSLPDADNFDMDAYKKELLEKLDVVVQEATEKEWFKQYKANKAYKCGSKGRSFTLSDNVPKDEPKRRDTIPYWKKFNLTIEEASLYFEIGEKKMRELIERFADKGYFIKNGRKTLIKRSLFEQFINGLDAI